MDPFDVDVRSIRRFAAGDAVAVLVFVMVGEYSHGANPFQFAAVADAAIPFYVGWIVAAPLVGAYAAAARDSVRVSVLSGALAWLGADLVAQGLRATTMFGGDAAFSFFLVALLVGGALIGGFRIAAVRLLGR